MDRSAFLQMVAKPAPYPGGFTGRGIVTCADGERYEASLYVLVRLLRHLGCPLPVQCWHLASEALDGRVTAALRALGVSFAAADPSWHGGWQLKARAVLDCPWQEVLFLDADCDPVRNPAEIFAWPPYAAAGAVFWPGFQPCIAKEWESFGVPVPAELQWETGQWAVDKARCWPALRAADWLLERSATVFQLVYGDPEVLHIAWRATQTPFATPPHPPGWSVHTVLQYDFAGAVLFNHRTADKWRLKNFAYPTKQCSSAMVRNRALANEDVSFEFFRDYAALVGHTGFLPGFPWSAK